MSQMFLNVVSTFKGDGLSAATRQLGAFGQAAGGLGSTLGKVGAALASFGLISKAKDFFGDAIDGARDLERNIFGVRKVFGSFAPEMIKFAENANKIGLSQSEAAKASTFLGSVLKQSGFSMEDVTEKTRQLVETGVDLATLYGYDVQEALLGMTALFRGEYDPIEKFGVAMKQSEINSELAARGFGNLEGAARRYQEQIIRFELFTSRASDSIGAFSEQSRNLFAAQKILTANFKDMQAEVGTELLPVMAELTESLLPLLKEIMPKLSQAFRDAIPGIQTFAGFLRDLGDDSTTTNQSFVGLLDILGRVFRIVAENAGLILQLAGVFLFARTAVALFAAAAALTPFGAIVAGFAAVAGTTLVAIDRFKEVRKGLDKTSTSLTDAQKDTVALSESLSVLSVLGGPVVLLFDKIRVAILNYILALNGIPTEITTDVRVNYINPRQADAAAGIFDTGDVGKAVEDDGTAADLASAGGAGAKKTLSGLPALIAASKKSAKVLKKELKLGGKGLSTEVAKWVTSSSTPVKAANQALKRIAKNGDKAVKNLTRNYKNSAVGQQAAAAEAAAAAEEMARAQEEAARAEAEALAERERIYNSFLDSVKNTFAGIKNSIMGAFDITGLGGSTNSVLRNMEKMLVRLRSFSTSVKQLATMGLDPALLQQIISMGPLAGARLASNLVSGGASGLMAINAGFGEFGSLASDIATTGTNALFGTQQQQNVYNINVSGGVGSGATIGKAIVDAIKAYERTSGAVWQGA